MYTYTCKKGEEILCELEAGNERELKEMASAWKTGRRLKGCQETAVIHWKALDDGPTVVFSATVGAYTPTDRRWWTAVGRVVR